MAAAAPMERDGRPGAETLRASAVSRAFDGVQALRGVDLTLQRGEVVGLIGPNGSGKTTAFNLIDGMMRADGGEVWLEERRIDRLRPWSRAHLGLGRTFQITRLFRQMTVLENVVAPLRSFAWRQLTADAVAGHEAERAEELLDFVGMHRFKDVQAGALSYGSPSAFTGPPERP